MTHLRAGVVLQGDFELAPRTMAKRVKKREEAGFNIAADETSGAGEEVVGRLRQTRRRVESDNEKRSPLVRSLMSCLHEKLQGGEKKKHTLRLDPNRFLPGVTQIEFQPSAV